MWVGVGGLNMRQLIFYQNWNGNVITNMHHIGSTSLPCLLNVGETEGKGVSAVSGSLQREIMVLESRPQAPVTHMTWLVTKLVPQACQHALIRVEWEFLLLGTGGQGCRCSQACSNIGYAASEISAALAYP